MTYTVQFKGVTVTVNSLDEAAALTERLASGAASAGSVPEKVKRRQEGPPKAQKPQAPPTPRGGMIRMDHIPGSSDEGGKNALRLLNLIRDAGKDGVSTRRLVVEFGFKDQRGLGPLANLLISRLSKLGFARDNVYTKAIRPDSWYYVAGEEIGAAIRALEGQIRQKAA